MKRLKTRSRKKKHEEQIEQQMSWVFEQIEELEEQESRGFKENTTVYERFEQNER